MGRAIRNLLARLELTDKKRSGSHLVFGKKFDLELDPSIEAYSNAVSEVRGGNYLGALAIARNSLNYAQQEVVSQEILDHFVQNAGSMNTREDELESRIVDALKERRAAPKQLGRFSHLPHDASYNVLFGPTSYGENSVGPKLVALNALKTERSSYLIATALAKGMHMKQVETDIRDAYEVRSKASLQKAVHLMQEHGVKSIVTYSFERREVQDVNQEYLSTLINLHERMENVSSLGQATRLKEEADSHGIAIRYATLSKRVRTNRKLERKARAAELDRELGLADADLYSGVKKWYIKANNFFRRSVALFRGTVSYQRN